MSDISPGKYTHYSGKMYEVIGEGMHSETREKLVFYRALYDDPEVGNNALWVRPTQMFLEMVEIDGKKIPRFQKVD